MNCILDESKVTEDFKKRIRDFVWDGTKYHRTWRDLDCFYIEQGLQLKKSDVVLELGSGYTHAYVYFASQCKHLTVSDDFSYTDKDYAQGFDIPAWGTEALSIGNVTPMSLDAADLSVFKDETFDKIYSISAIEHVHDDFKSLQEAYRVLKPGGIYCLTTELNLFTGMPYAEMVCYRVYSLDQFHYMIHKAGFDVTKIFNKTCPDEKVARMREAVDDPSLLVIPMQNFVSAVFTLVKK